MATAPIGGSVEIPRFIENQSRQGRPPVRARVSSWTEAIQYGFVVAGIQHKYGPGTVSAAAIGGAIEISRSVPNQSSIGVFPVRCSPGEAVQHCFVAAGTQHK